MGCVGFGGHSCHRCLGEAERGCFFAVESGCERSPVDVGGSVNRIEAGSGEGCRCGDGRFGALHGGEEETASVSMSESVILNSPWLSTWFGEGSGSASID